MFKNIFKFSSVVFLLFVFSSSTFAQTTLIDPAGDGGFSNGSTFAANGWTESNSTNNPWVIGTVPPYAAGNSAYVSTDGGTTYTYSNTSPCLNFYYRDVTVPAGETIITLSFNWISYGESSYDIWQVFYAPTSVVPVGTTTYPGSGTTLVPSAITGATFIGYGQLQSTVQSATYTLPASLAGTTFRLIFSWKSDTSVGTDPPASMDNISLISSMPITPAPPISFTATSVTTTSMDIGWTDNSTDEVSFRVYKSTDNITFYQSGSDIPSTSVGTTGTLYSQSQTGLLPGVTYYFRIAAVADLESAYLTGSQATLAAGSITSNGTGGGLWSVTTTWTGGVVPTATDNVTILDGDVVTLDATGLVCNNLTVGGGTSGTLEYQATPLAGLTVNGNLTISTNATFTAGTGTLLTHTLAIGSNTGTEAISGDLINNGTFDLYSASLAGVTTTFLGFSNTTISGTGTTPDFYAITVNKGTTRDGATLDVTVPITMSVVTSSTVRLVLTNGTFKISSATDITPAGGTKTIIDAGGRLWLNHASAVYNGTFGGSPTIAGELRIDDGTFNYGVGNNTMTITSTGGGGALVMNGGTINMYGAVSFSSNAGVVFNMTGGNFNVDPQATLLSGTSTTFSIGTSTTVNWSGGVVTIIDPRATAGSTSFSNFSNTLGNKIITGGKLRLGDGTSTASGGTLSTTSGFSISASGGVWDLEIDNRTDASDSRVARVSGTTVVLNTIEIKTNGSLYLGSSATGYTLVVEGNMINNGLLAGNVPSGTAVIGTLYFRGLGPQSLTGTGTFTPIANLNFYNLGTTFSRSDFVYSEENDLWNQQAELSGEVREMRPIYIVSGKRSEPLNLNPQPSTITFSNTSPLVVNRVNCFSGNLTPGANFTIGSTVSQPIVQIGSGIDTAPGGTFSTIPLFDNTVAPSTYIYSVALGSHTTGAYNEMPAGAQTWTQVLINDVDGLFLDRPVTVNSFMTLTIGNINTTSTNLLTYVATTTLTESATSYINGPFARVIPVSTVAGTTLNYPIGKGTFMPTALIDPVTGAGGPVVISQEVFDADAGGTPGTGLISLNTNRYWNASIVSGATDFTSTKVRLTEDGLTNSNGMGKSETQTGVYNLVSSSFPSGGTITSDVLTSLSYFVIGTLDLSVPDPTGVTALAISSSQIDVAFTPNASNHIVVIVFNLTGTFTVPSGPPPAPGDPFAGGTFLDSTITSPYAHTGLNMATTYYYKLFSYDGTDYSFGVATNATTLCGTITAFPFTESFDDVTFPPNCWANTQVSGTGLWNRVTAGTSPTCTPHSGAGMARYNCYSFNSGTSAILVTPEITFPGADYKVVFWMYRDGGYSGILDRVVVHYNTSPDTTGGTLLGTINRSMTQSPVVPSEGWYEYTFNMPAGTSGNAYVIFQGISEYGNNIFVDDVTIEQLPTEPVFVINPTSKDYGTLIVGESASQDFVITNGGAGTLTISTGGISLVGADPGEFTLGTVTYPINLATGESDTVNVSFTPTTAGDKTADLQIVDNTTDATHTVPLTGTALPAGILFEDFTNVNALARWTVVNLDGGANYWERLTGKYHSAPASAGSYYESSTLQNNDWLISPKLIVSSGDSLGFWHSILSTSFPESLYVMVGTTNDPTTGVWDTLDVIFDNTLDWKYESYDITTYAGDKYIAFVNRSLDAYVLFVDDIIGPVVYVPAVDLAFTDFYQSTGLPVPGPGEKFTNYNVTMNDNLMLNGKKQIDVLSKNVVGVHSSFIERVHPISYDGTIPFNPTLANIDVKGVINNLGLNAASYNLDWSVGGVAQTTYNGPSVAVAGSDTANLTYSPTDRGTFLTAGNITVTADENPGNDVATPFRMRVYPDAFTRTIYDRGDNIIDTYIGWGSATIRMKAGVKFTAPSTDIKLAGVDYICRTETVTSGTWEIQVRDTSSSPGAPGAVLYSVVISASDYFAGSGDYIYFPFDDTAPVIPAGDDYWITIKAPLGILYPGAAHNTGFTAGRSYYESSSDTTVWSPLVISYERAWIMRSVEVEAGGTTFQLTVNVTNGWNMVSIPGLNTPDQNVDTWWAFRDPGASVFKYAGGYQAITDAVPGLGYWMKHSGALTYNTGEEWPAGGIQIVAHDPIAGATGWNMIGGYEIVATTALITTNPLGQQSGPVYKYSGGYQVATTLDPGYGYWIKLLSAAQIIIPETLAKGTEPVEYFPDDWGKIVLTDATGINYTLYAVKGDSPNGEAKVDLSQYELPPAPMAGMFDIRFSSGRIAEDINSAIKTIEMSGVTYPLTVRVEGMDIRLMDETGKTINVNLKAGEDVVISDATIQKLMVSGELIPAKYALEQNYPNPFNPSTVIEFSLPENVGSVQLSIYNVLGEKVAELVNTALVAGKYSYQWNAKNVATGMYIYELRTDKFVSVKKMLLLK